MKSKSVESTDFPENVKSSTDSGFSSTQMSSQESCNNEIVKSSKTDTDICSILPSLTDFEVQKSSLAFESQKLESRYACANIQLRNNSASALSPDSNIVKGPVSGAAPETKSSGLDDPCMICLSRPKTASLIHGTSGHQVCCFTCAKRLKRRGQDCPVCRRSIQKVIRNYIL